MTDPQFKDLVYKMRQAQKNYFKNRLNRDLQDSKALEKEVDFQLSKRICAQALPKEEKVRRLKAALAQLEAPQLEGKVESV